MKTIKKIALFLLLVAGASAQPGPDQTPHRIVIIDYAPPRPQHFSIWNWFYPFLP